MAGPLDPFARDESFTLYLGDCAAVMAALPTASIDAVVCDPPYGLEFMGKEWDRLGGDAGMSKPRIGERETAWPSFGGGEFGGANPTCAKCRGRARGAKRCECEAPDWRVKGAPLDSHGNALRSTEDPLATQLSEQRGGGDPFIGKGIRYAAGRDMQSWHEAWAREALRLLKPGGHLLAFGGTRTYHRLACGLEDAGFEIRDTICWMYGSGFPKSKNLEGDWEGWGTALKPAFEPIVVARKPLVGTVAGNVLKHGTGALNIEGCRIAGVKGAPASPRRAEQGSAFGDLGKDPGTGSEWDVDAGRWPANVVLDEEAAAMLDEQTGVLTSGKEPDGGFVRHEPTVREGIYGGGKGLWKDEQEAGALFGDSGGASRFFYCAKTSRAERNGGLDRFAAVKSADDGYGSIQTPIIDRAAPRENWEPHKSANMHPTVKPVALMRWLCRLVTPPEGTILDPFLGSGTTGIAAGLEGFQFIGVERDETYMPIAEARIRFWSEHGERALDIADRDKRAETARVALADDGQLNLLGG